MDKNSYELLAPAGNLLKLKTVLQAGADAVYLGVPDFSLRARANDFDLEAVKEGVRVAHEAGAKAYVTLNIFAKEEHLQRLPHFIEELKKIGPDALIISDPGIISLVKQSWPQAVIHLSTQANCTNSAAAKFWFNLGVARVILAREVTLEEIAAIHQAVPDLELEYFVHGAMCLAYSGRCLLSQEFTGRSANLGDCAQPCRWSYSIKADGHPEELEVVQEKDGAYILNSQDLCLLEYLPTLQKAGVTSFKIEGRAKSVYYQATTTGAYAQALKHLKDGLLSGKDLEAKLQDLRQELNTKLPHRGYNTGFLLGDKAKQTTDRSAFTSDWEFCGQVVAPEDSWFKPNLSKDDKAVYFKVHNTWLAGDTIEVVRPYYDVLKAQPTILYDAVSGEELLKAHGGGGGQVVVVIFKENIPEYSVVRRYLKK